LVQELLPLIRGGKVWVQAYSLMEWGASALQGTLMTPSDGQAAAIGKQLCVTALPYYQLFNNFKKF
jgi:hypothetical protein